jgi:hypothetical protein
MSESLGGLDVVLLVLNLSYCNMCHKIYRRVGPVKTFCCTFERMLYVEIACTTVLDVSRYASAEYGDVQFRSAC